MDIVKKTIKEALALIVVASILGFVANEMKGDARVEPFKNYFAKRDPNQPVASEAGESVLQESPIASGSLEKPEHGYQEISFDALADLYLEGPVEAGIVVLVDARGDESFAEGHIPGALQCDHYKLERHIYSVLDAVKASDKVVVYCTGGKCEDSIFVCGDLMDFGVPYEKIYLFKGGWEEWIKNNMPVEGGGVN